MKNVIIAFVLLLIGCGERPKLERILSDGSATFLETLDNEKHEIQIIYGEVKGDSIIHHVYGDTSQYFYPASTIKMLNAFASIQWLRENKLSLRSTVQMDSTVHHPRNLTYDSLFKDSLRVENLLKKIFVYSDNQANNILFNTIGKDYVNGLYANLGLKTRIIHQLGESAFSFTPESNSWSAKTIITHAKNAVKSAASKQDFNSDLSPKNQRKGKGYMNKSGDVIMKPFDFTVKNYVPLRSLIGSLERVIKPSFFRVDSRFDFDKQTYQELEEIMSLRPIDLPYPIDTLKDNYVKFLIYGDSQASTYDESMVIMNKVGWAYGYLTDVAYIKDTKNDVEFFLAATIHVNENEIYNDGIYEYDSVGLPFLGELGRLVYQYELNK
ncbi:serine hydrolase [Ekhidna sp.]|uniref:serine hydrolase n=1 Tax=Ekhidna sp. TaxID=2608089 RepID=UPI003CCC0220